MGRGEKKLEFKGGRRERETNVKSGVREEGMEKMGEVEGNGASLYFSIIGGWGLEGCEWVDS